MTIYESWLNQAYDQQGNVIKKLWERYLPLEQKIYENMLSSKNPVIEGKMSDLAERYNMPLEFVSGFLDGISGALDTQIDMQELTEDSFINVNVDFETLYKKMVEYNATHLMALPEWENVYSEEKRESLYKEQKSSKTVKREGEKIGRNEPCPCGSQKKYKKCCGAA